MGNNNTAFQDIDDNTEPLAKKTADYLADQIFPIVKKDGEFYRQTIIGARFSLSFLAQSIYYDSYPVYKSCVEWSKIYFQGLKFPEPVLKAHLQSIQEVIRHELSGSTATAADSFISRVILELSGLNSIIETYMEKGNPYYDILLQYNQLLLETKSSEAGRLILDLAKSGFPMVELYENVFRVSQLEIGRLWQMNEISVAAEHYCTAATQVIMAQLYPFIFSNKARKRKIVSTCVNGELHEIGIRMLTDMFEMDGWDTSYLGANMPEKDIVQFIGEQKADMILISSSMIFLLNKVHSLVEKIRENKSTKDTKIMVGGYAFNIDQDLWKKTGADAYSKNSIEAIRNAGVLIG